MQEASTVEKQYVCVFITSDSSVWTKKMSELRVAGSSAVTVGSKVSLKFPVQFIDERGKEVIVGEQEYDGTVLFHSAGLSLCKEKEKHYCQLISENRGAPVSEILNLLLRDGNKLESNKDEVNGDDERIPSKRRKRSDSPKLQADSPHSGEFSGPITPAYPHSMWTQPSASVKLEQTRELRQRTSVEEDVIQLSWNGTQSDEEEEKQKKEESPFAVLEKLIKDNQALRKENARLKEALIATQNAAPFRLLSQEARQSAAYYLRMVLENLEGTGTVSSMPFSSALASRNHNPATAQGKSVHNDKYVKPLIIDPDDPDRYAHILVDPMKLHNVLKKAREQKSNQESCLLNGVIDLVFTFQELAESHGLGLKGKDKEDKALDRVKVAACEEEAS
nr:PREDICTED: uncharacterized protein LOC102347417 isoform X2 [Latimeria chalumnae]|eukprot:XP_014354266.1 PREDICTED: uncharacterized protein LOC102347417 isoform X2 [Latimeria chalumnae]